MLAPNILGENLFDDFFSLSFPDDKEQRKLERELYGHQGKDLTKTDIRETDSGYELKMDLPGFAKNKAKVSLKDGTLITSASKGFDQDKQEKRTGRYTHGERYVGTCERFFYVRKNLTEADIEGEFRYGILKLFVLKKGAGPVVEEKKYITIEQ